MYTLAMWLTVLVPIAILTGGIILTEKPEIIPGHDARVEKRKQRKYAKQLKWDRQRYKDITELAVSMGHPDPGEGGWYGFNVVGEEGILYFDGRRLHDYCYRDTYSAQETLEYVLRELAKKAEYHIKVSNKRKQLEQMVDGRPILGGRRPWQED